MVEEYGYEREYEEFDDEERRRRSKKDKKGDIVKVGKDEGYERSRESTRGDSSERAAITIPMFKISEPPGRSLAPLDLAVPRPRKEATKLDIVIPSLQLTKSQTPLLNELDYRIPKVEKGSKFSSQTIIPTPIFKAPVTGEVFKLDYRTPVITSERGANDKASIPIYIPHKHAGRVNLVTLDKNLPKLGEVKKSEEEIKEGGRAAVSINERASTGAGASPPEDTSLEYKRDFQDPLETFFGSGAGRLRYRGPKVILFKDAEDDSYLQFLENLCLRIYRELEGGEPKAVMIEKLDDMNKKEIEKYLEAGHKIFTINLEKEIDKLDSVVLEHFRERLWETYSQANGFIILTVKSGEKFNRLNGLLDRINYSLMGKLNIIKLRAPILEPQQKERLISLLSGMLDVSNLSHGAPQVFDLMLNKSLFNEDSLFNQRLREIMNEEDGLFIESTKRSEEESWEHFSIKVFLVRYLTHKLRNEGKTLLNREEIMNEIKTEFEEDGVRPDIKIKDEVYEVETLFKEGAEAHLKITETIDKYRNISGIKTVNIVMDNLGFLLHLKDLLKKKKQLEKSKDKRFETKFYTLNLNNKTLISLENFIRQLSNIKAIHAGS